MPAETKPKQVLEQWRQTNMPNDVREDGSPIHPLETISRTVNERGGPNLLTFGGAVQQPGVIVPGMSEDYQPSIQEKLPAGLFVKDLASDKFAVTLHMIDGARAYQILPADPHRKWARLNVVPASTSTAGIPTTPQLGTNTNGQVTLTSGGFRFTPPINNAPYVVDYITAFLVCSATVLSRILTLLIGNSNATLTAIGEPVAGNHVQVTWLPGINNETALIGPTSGQYYLNNSFISGPILAGSIIQLIGIPQMDAGDVWSQIAVQYRYAVAAPVVSPNQLFVGNMSQIDAIINGLAPFPQAFPLFATTVNDSFEYTSKAPLWGVAPGGLTACYTMVERFDSGTPVT
jgi:hypothetical protein